jgi:predicted nucleotide-binding protein
MLPNAYLPPGVHLTLWVRLDRTQRIPHAHGGIPGGSTSKIASPDRARTRPRQNILLELGYFVGKLTRARVFALKREGELELPNDIAGLVYTPYDAAGHRRFELVRELKAAGYTVDANSLI